MAITYSRSFLFSQRFWWKKIPEKIKPVVLTEWNVFKAAGILKSTRGKRSGSNHLQKHGTCQIPLLIPSIRVNKPVRSISRTQNCRNFANLLNIRKQSEFRSMAGNSPGSHYVPSLLLSNTMSLAPKIDEIAYTVNNIDSDIAFFTETWLRENVPDEPISINGYKLYRRDRVNGQHGGVCMYVC
jgi:hypothetical protein